MRPFSRHRGFYVASIEPVEVRLLTDLVGQVRTLLADRRAEAPSDPLAALTGMTMGPADAPTDPAVARLLPDFHRDDADFSSGLRMLHEREVIAAKDDAAATLLRTLPEEGGPFRLDEPQARSWLVALNDIRLAFGVRIGITDDIEEPPAASADPDSAEFAMYETYRWLSAVQESLVMLMLDSV